MTLMRMVTALARLARHPAPVPAAGTAVIALAALYAYWSPAFENPIVQLQPAAAPPAIDVLAAGEAIIASGILNARPDPAIAETSEPRSTVTLAGVVAADGRAPSYALLTLEAGVSVVVQQGREVAPGIVLAKVARDHVMLRRADQLERIDLPEQPREPGIIESASGAERAHGRAVKRAGGASMQTTPAPAIELDPARAGTTGASPIGPANELPLPSRELLQRESRRAAPSSSRSRAAGREANATG